MRRRFSIGAADARFGPTADLFESGYVDSIGFAELLEFIQVEFDVEIPDEDLLSDEFATIAGIGRIVARCAKPGR